MEGLHLGHAVNALHALGVLASLKRKSTVATLARRHGLDASLLAGTLSFVAARTDIIRKEGAGFVAGEGYGPASRFQIDLYAGAYGPNAAKLAAILARPSAAPGLVDRQRQTQAFQSADPASNEWIASAIYNLGWNYLLDIGCGTCALLIGLTGCNKEFVGWGLEASKSMCAGARVAIRKSGASGRLQVWNGDIKQIRSAIPSRIASSIQAVCASQVVNEMFGEGTKNVIAWLAKLRRLLPGRPMLIADYYGRLGTLATSPDRATLLHDFVQLISGQGIPPASLKEWQSIYKAAGCRLVHATEDTASTRFLHVIVL